MPTGGGYDYGTQRKRKVWRYPGVPIPWRLQSRYYDPTVRKRTH